MNDPFKHNNSSVKADFITSPNSDDNSYTNESQSFSEKKTETSQQNIKNKKFHFVDGQEIRERRKRISQDSQSSPSTHSDSRTVNIFYQPRNVIIAFSVFISIVAAIWLMPASPPSTFFEKFAGTTGDIMENVNSIELPAANTVMEHTVACRRAANLVQKGIAFETHGVQIATGLREFGEKIKEAGNLLKNMYSKGSAVYVSFDIEIEAMMSRLSSTRRQLGDSKYFKERLNSLITKVREFRALVGKTHSSIIDAENARDIVERFVVEGLKEAEIFVVKNDCHSSYNDANCHSIKVAKKELEVVNNTLEHLYNTGDHLDKMEKILKNYEDKLMDLSAELETAGNGGEDDVFEVTKADLKYLKFAIDNSKACLHKFERLSG